MKKFLLSSLAISLIISASAIAAEAEKSKPENKQETMRLLSLFGDTFEKIRQEYVEKPDDKKLIEAAINGMLTSLDAHSNYMDEKEFSDMQAQTKGEFGGLGLEVTMDNGLVKVVSPIDDTPAAKAGVKSGDFISEIDEKPVMGMTLSEAIDKLRGKPGTKIKITVLRKNEKEPLKIDLVRDVIKIKSVRVRKEGDDIAYLRVSSFADQADRNLKSEFEKLKKDMGGKLKGVVLDLRNNPGGLLDQAIGISDLFLEKGEVVSTRGRVSDGNKRFSAKEGDITGGLPMVVLINGGSASASEIVAGALQDQKRAVVLGTKSFGKGSVQTVLPVMENSAMKLTTSRYYTPSGNSIQAKGITPDIEVEPAKIQFLDKKSTAEADLIRHLNNDQDGGDDKAAKDTKSEAKPDEPQGSAAIEKSLYDADYQLARALDLLRAVSVFKNEEDKKAKDFQQK